jgi:hypothetical protein
VIKSPFGAKSAQEKSSRSLMFVLQALGQQGKNGRGDKKKKTHLILVDCKLQPIASATLMKRLAKRVRGIGSGLPSG